MQQQSGRELPPRTRRILTILSTEGHTGGTTSAHAENTTRNPKVTNPTLELPPRTRRIPAIKAAAEQRIGTTSAHAENTKLVLPPIRVSRNYLRARGEYITGTTTLMLSWELPPRTRRILMQLDLRDGTWGTTSAHAENTNQWPAPQKMLWNYLRARGEYRLRA